MFKASVQSLSEHTTSTEPIRAQVVNGGVHFWVTYEN